MGLPQVLSQCMRDRIVPDGRGMRKEAPRKGIRNRIVRHRVPDCRRSHVRIMI